MKFTCTKENFLQGVQAVAPITGKQVHLPILNNILILAETTGLKVIGTNLELWLIATVRGLVEVSGSFTIPAKTLSEFISLLPAESRIDCELIENELVLKSGKQRVKIKGTPANDFPVTPAVQVTTEMIFPSNKLKQALARVLVSVSHSDVRPEFQGVLVFTESEDELRATFASTDSYRLTEVKSEILKSIDQPIRIIIPQRAAHEIQRLIGGISDPVKINIGDGQLACLVGDVQIISRLVDKSYPDYRQIIPKTWNTEVKISAEELTKTIRAASLFATQGVNAVSLEVKPSNEIAIVASASSQTGEHSAEISIDGSGDDNKIILNHRYLLDGLVSINEERAVIRVVNGESPCVLVPETADDYLYIIMPIRQ